MTARYSVDDELAPRGHPLAKGASPRAIRSALLPEDQPEFDAAYEAALAEAKTSQDLTDLFTTLEWWRGIAVLQSDPEVFRRVARRAAELLTGEASPGDEPLSETRRKADMQVCELNSDDVADQLADLPADALPALAEVRSLLEVAPWSGEPVSITNPDGAVRFVPFASAVGSGFVYYLILEEQRRVDLLQLIWLS